MKARWGRGFDPAPTAGQAPGLAMLSSVLEWLSPRGLGRWATFVRVTFFWSPLTCAGFTLVFSRFDDIGGYFFDLQISLVIATTSVVTCFSVGQVLEWAGKQLHVRRGLPERERSLGWNLLRSGAGLPMGVYLGFLGAGALFGFDPPSIRSLGIGVVMGTMAMLGFFLHETVLDLREAKQLAALRSQQAESERLRGEVRALTAQMNPHLLFNTLNTIASLAQSDPNAAEATTIELAELYRGVLRAARCEEHPLADELAICRAYLRIEQARFGERLSHTITTDGIDPESLPVPPLLLQPLVENAVKHGLSPRAEGGTVRVTAEPRDGAVVLRVTDDGVGLKNGARKAHESTALQNLRTRLELLHGSRASLDVRPREAGGTVAELVLPLERAT